MELQTRTCAHKRMYTQITPVFICSFVYLRLVALHTGRTTLKLFIFSSTYILALSLCSLRGNHVTCYYRFRHVLSSYECYICVLTFYGQQIIYLWIFLFFSVSFNYINLRTNLCMCEVWQRRTTYAIHNYFSRESGIPSGGETHTHPHFVLTVWIIHHIYTCIYKAFVWPFEMHCVLFSWQVLCFRLVHFVSFSL